MREILFRAKAINRDPNRAYRTNYKNGDWVYGLITKLYDDNYPAEMRNTNGVSGIDVDYKTIGEYTGLKDKNGKRIFEGDIVLLKSDEEPYQVEFDEYCFQVYSHSVCYVMDNFYDHDIEVIGNIHDNPELLKEGNNG